MKDSTKESIQIIFIGIFGLIVSIASVIGVISMYSQMHEFFKYSLYSMFLLPPPFIIILIIEIVNLIKNKDVQNISN